MATQIIDQTGQNVPAPDESDKPFFGHTRRPGIYFTVTPGVADGDALDAASMFLSTAIGLGGIAGCEKDENIHWAMVHFAEMAKGLIDGLTGAAAEAGRPVG